MHGVFGTSDTVDVAMLNTCFGGIFIIIVILELKHCIYVSKLKLAQYLWVKTQKSVKIQEE